MAFMSLTFYKYRRNLSQVEKEKNNRRSIYGTARTEEKYFLQNNQGIWKYTESKPAMNCFFFIPIDG
ncbi:TPA: hypothetical protein QCX34_004724 [Bacillus anthracis]|nr:hypothetical protein [Bacillus anthracis]